MGRTSQGWAPGAGEPPASRAAGLLAPPALVPRRCWSQPSNSRATFSTTQTFPVAKPSARGADS
eukprot:1741068-Alexandrium_andersonii.AAC.1